MNINRRHAFQLAGATLALVAPALPALAHPDGGEGFRSRKVFTRHRLHIRPNVDDVVRLAGDVTHRGCERREELPLVQ